MVGPKLSSRQQAQLAFLGQMAPRLDRFHALIEQLGTLRADETAARQLSRGCDELKVQATGLGLTALADTLGFMGTLARRTGGTQAKVRGLRELLGSLKINYEGAVKHATTPGAADEGGAGDG